MDDNQVDALIRRLPHGVDTQRLWRVRRAILTSLPPHIPVWQMIFGPRSALLTATALLGLLMGVSVPGVLSHDVGSTADILSPADPTGGFG